MKNLKFTVSLSFAPSDFEKLSRVIAGILKADPDATFGDSSASKMVQDLSAPKVAQYSSALRTRYYCKFKAEFRYPFTRRETARFSANEVIRECLTRGIPANELERSFD